MYENSCVVTLVDHVGILPVLFGTPVPIARLVGRKSIVFPQCHPVGLLRAAIGCPGYSYIATGCPAEAVSRYTSNGHVS